MSRQASPPVIPLEFLHAGTKTTLAPEAAPRGTWPRVRHPKLTFVQIPLVTKSGGLDPDEALYYDAYWRRMEQIFDHRFEQAEVYTVPEFPLWVTTLGNAVRDAGCESSFVDLASFTGPREEIPYDRIAARLAAEPADVYALSPFTNNYSVAVEIQRLIRREINPSARVILGGAHATALQQRCAADGFDAVAGGRGEETLTATLEALKLGDTTPLADVGDLLWRDGDTLHANGKRASRPYTYFNRLPNYDMIGRDYKVHFARVYGSLGCPYGCSFCADTLWIKMKPYYKDVRVLVDEIRMIREKYGVDVFLFGDEVFTLDMRFAEEVCAAIKAEGIRWFCQTRANLLAKERARLLPRMAEAGCRLVQIGAESADEAVLQQLEKQVTFDVVQDACRAAKAAGLSVLTYWMIGGPGETYASARRSMDSIVSLFKDGLTDLADYYICVPYPGTDLFADPAKYDIQIVDRGTDAWREDQPSVMRTRELDEHQIFALWKDGLRTIAEQMRRPARAS